MDKDYNEDSVCYCKRCLSLAIRKIPDVDGWYCSECGNTELEESSIEEWESLYRSKHGREFLDRTKRVFKYN